MKRTFITVILISILLSACAPSESVIQTSIAQTELARPTSTPMPSATKVPTATKTLTPSPTYTHLPTLTPTNTLTPTITPTPIPLSMFKPLTFWETMLKSPELYEGKYIKAYAIAPDSRAPGIYKTAHWLASPTFGPRGVYVYLSANPKDGEVANAIGKFTELWIYGVIGKPKEGLAQVEVYQIEEIPNLKMSHGEGVFKVGTDIAPGKWKNGEDATTLKTCYWARIAENGDIIQNYYGYGGSTINIKSTDFAIEIKECGGFFFLGE